MLKRSLISAAVLGTLVLASVGFKGSVDSGIKVGEFVTAFHPNHIVGPHKGTDACPPCTYGKLPAVQFWVNGDDVSNVEAIAKLLDHRVGNWEKSNFKAFVIFVTTPESKASTAKQIQDIAKKDGIDIAMAWIDKGNEAIENYEINTSPEMKNTIFVYKDMKVVHKFVNLKADEKGIAQLNASINGITK
jgi:hypothetical protein